MGNHTIDCRFCGEDQRLTLRCCAQAVAEEQAAEEQRRQREQALQEGLQRYGLSYWGNGQVNAADTLKVLTRMSAAIVEGRSGCTAQPVGVCEELPRRGAPCDCYDDGVGPVLGAGCRAMGTHSRPSLTGGPVALSGHLEDVRNAQRLLAMGNLDALDLWLRRRIREIASPPPSSEK